MHCRQTQIAFVVHSSQKHFYFASAPTSIIARATAAEKVVSLVENDNSDYFNDVLSGTDEYEEYRTLHASCE